MPGEVLIALAQWAGQTAVHCAIPKLTTTTSDSARPPDAGTESTVSDSSVTSARPACA
jgi:hypothetical protein